MAKHIVDHWLWVCPFLAILVAVAVFMIFGLSVWTAFFAALLLTCLAIMIWGLFKSRRG